MCSPKPLRYSQPDIFMFPVRCICTFRSLLWRILFLADPVMSPWPSFFKCNRGSFFSYCGVFSLLLASGWLIIFQLAERVECPLPVLNKLSPNSRWLFDRCFRVNASLTETITIDVTCKPQAVTFDRVKPAYEKVFVDNISSKVPIVCDVSIWLAPSISNLSV